MISIHAPLTRCDPGGWIPAIPLRHFNPRTSHEVRLSAADRPGASDKFQSTHLSRGATLLPEPPVVNLGYFNPRTSHEVRLCACPRSSSCPHFNPRTSHEVRHTRFPAHVLLFNFNPRTSHEVRRYEPQWADNLDGFQSTHLSRGATAHWTNLSNG